MGFAESPWVVRPGRLEDHAVFARLFLELGVDDPPPPESMWAAELAPLALLAEGPRGVEAYGVAESLGTFGYVSQLVVAPSARGKGLGRTMMAHLAEHLRAQGCARWGLNVKRDNVPALALYTSLGMRPVREATTLRVTRAHLDALPPASPEGRLVPVTREDCDALTEAFRMVPGKLACFVARASHRVLGLVDSRAPGRQWLGMMDLRASGPTLFPFFAVSPAHARTLLEDAFLRMGEGVSSLNVALMDDAPLVQRLRDAGAQTRLETFQLQGPLPDAGP
ncbi:acetyltransferase, GNAT family [Myxococcus hansupus]|uniref:Acetyltransferase, GNAT family n=1 Tax=Pseudomyxococcus hansupus TaxID=1297742 RepID=A0A0H4XL45_9BACT|nr:GNAT family N-acetyltransferase [Myxococcus hansupus]AKQ68977.1 acetyltransferase, GNAT family [Myxococcus hansupus]